MIDRATANKIYDIAVEECFASQENRLEFVEYAINPEGDRKEWRFCGKLGIGGKIHIDNWAFRINCYSEDMTGERDEMINSANTRLASLFAQSTFVRV